MLDVYAEMPTFSFQNAWMILGYNQEKLYIYIYDQMVKNLQNFYFISPIFFACIKQNWSFVGPKWVMIKQNV